jgi:flagellar L-ring protein precursor FlgH
VTACLRRGPLRCRAALLAPLLLAGCIDAPARPDAAAYAPVYAPHVVPPPATPGAIYRDGAVRDLFSDHRALAVGDVITVNLEERFQSSKSAASSVNRESATSLPEPTLLGQRLRGPGGNAGLLSDLESSNEFSGAAEADQSNLLRGTLTVTVTDRLPNGLLMVQGEKWLTLNRGAEYVRLSGLLRQEDVGANNVVSSQRIADARITYSGTGELADAAAPGWLTRFFASPLWPW